jgi:chromosome transmission fidelity protein 18
MQSVWGVDQDEKKFVFGEGRPNCLILDEIDGATGDGGKGEDKGAIDMLCKIIQGKTVSRRARGAVARQAGEKKQTIGRLTRPIICICNDQYAPALRPLRQIAKIFVFDQPTKTRV